MDQNSRLGLSEPEPEYAHVLSRTMWNLKANLQENGKFGHWGPYNIEEQPLQMLLYTSAAQR
jgi:hypothetical protein